MTPMASWSHSSLGSHPRRKDGGSDDNQLPRRTRAPLYWLFTIGKVEGTAGVFNVYKELVSTSHANQS